MTEKSDILEIEEAFQQFIELKDRIEFEFSAFWEIEPCKWLFKNFRQKKLLDKISEPQTKKLAKILKDMLKNKYPYTYNEMSPEERYRVIMEDPMTRQLGELIFDIPPKENSFLIEFNRKD